MDGLEALISYINSYRRLELRRKNSENALLGISFLLIFFLVCVLLDRALPFFSGMQASIRILFWVLVIAIAVKGYFDRHALEKTPGEKFAISIEKKFPALGCLLINAWQLSERSKNYPEEFIALLRSKAAAAISRFDLSSAIERRRLVLARRICLGVVALVIASVIIFPTASRNTFFKLFVPARYVPDIIVEPGDCAVERGSSLLIRATLKNQQTPYIELRDGIRRTEQMIPQRSSFIYSISEISGNLQYRITAGGRKTGWYTVRVVDKTAVERVKLTYRFPDYTGMKPRSEEKQLSEIAALYGTTVTAEFVFNNPVRDAWMVFGTGEKLESRGVSKSKTFTFVLRDATFFELHYRDFVTNREIITPKEKISIIFDQIPFIEFVEPGKDLMAKPGTTIPITLKASDDFGISSIRLRVHPGEGEISRNDRIFYQTGCSGAREKTVSLSFQVPQFSGKVAYYAECLDTFPGSPNTGRSAVYFIYPYGGPGRTGATGEKEKESQENVRQYEEMKKAVNRFIDEQKKVIEASKRIAETQNKGSPEDLKALAEPEKKWAEAFKKMLDDLNKMVPQTKGKSTLSDELVEMVSHLQKAIGAAESKSAPVKIFVTEAEMGLELAKELTSNLERWLAQGPDATKWELQEPSKPTEVPEAELPSELEDIIGDLLEKEQDMKEEIEDITSSWMDSLDKGAGWDAADGPISNMSAKGITGNTMPNQQEIGGRSGEGRSGRSSGEMVEKTAQGKGGRQTPARLTPDNIEQGQVQDSSNENQLGPTGGGKASGWGPKGLRGPVQDLTFRYAQLAEKQAQLIEKAEKLARELKVLNIYNPQLEQSISSMKAFTIQLKEGRYVNLLTTKQLIISQLQQARQVLTQQAIVRVTNSETIAKSRKDLGSMWDEKIPTGYEGIVRKYYQNIASR